MQTTRLQNDSHGPVIFRGNGNIDSNIGTYSNKRLPIGNGVFLGGMVVVVVAIEPPRVQKGKQTRAISKANANICVLCIVYSDIHSRYTISIGKQKQVEW